MEPAYGKVQPVAYRAPEVFFKSLITPAADIWSWGVIFCELLEAQIEHSEGGMYDNVVPGTMANAENSVSRAIFDDFDLTNVNFYNDCVLPPQNMARSAENNWAARLRAKGVPNAAVMFLTWVLNPDPLKRPSAKVILEHAYMTTPHLETESVNAASLGPVTRNHVYQPSPPLNTDSPGPSFRNYDPRSQNPTSVYPTPPLSTEALTSSDFNAPELESQNQTRDSSSNTVFPVPTASSTMPLPLERPIGQLTERTSPIHRKPVKHYRSPSLTNVDPYSKRIRPHESQALEQGLAVAQGDDQEMIEEYASHDLSASASQIVPTQSERLAQIYGTAPVTPETAPMENVEGASSQHTNAAGFQNPSLFERLKHGAVLGR